MKIEEDEVKRYIDIIKKLEPKPSRGFYIGDEIKYIIPDIFKLYDHLEKNMRKFYSNGVSNKKYGAIAGVTARKDGKEAFYVGMKDYKHLLDFSICFFLDLLG